MSRLESNLVCVYRIRLFLHAPMGRQHMRIRMAIASEAVKKEIMGEV
jgi:hypothetical protein